MIRVFTGCIDVMWNWQSEPDTRIHPFEVNPWSLVISAYYETFPLFSSTHFPSLSHRLFSLSASPLLKLIFTNSLPPSHKTRDNNVSHDGKGWQKVKQTVCAVVLIIEEEKQSVSLRTSQVSTALHPGASLCLLRCYRRLEKLLSCLLVWE